MLKTKTRSDGNAAATLTRAASASGQFDEAAMTITASISQTVHTYARNSQNLRVVILDEAHDFTAQAMASLKGLMTKFPSVDKGVFFILTTNHLSGISDPIRDRCLVLEVPATTVDDVLPMACRILDGECIPYAVDDLRTALTKDSSGLVTFREMWGVIEDIITRKSMP